MHRVHIEPVFAIESNEKNSIDMDFSYNKVTKSKISLMWHLAYNDGVWSFKATAKSGSPDWESELSKLDFWYYS